MSSTELSAASRWSVVSKATNRPSAESVPPPAPRLPSLPSFATFTRSIVPAVRSLTKRSVTPFVSPVTRSVAVLANRTNRQSGDISTMRPLAGVTPSADETSLVSSARSVEETQSDISRGNAAAPNDVSAALPNRGAGNRDCIVRLRSKPDAEREARGDGDAVRRARIDLERLQEQVRRREPLVWWNRSEEVEPCGSDGDERRPERDDQKIATKSRRDLRRLS